ncbi:MAG: methyltransferase [Bacteroidetes bacterium]|nr:methyltransferase [Bacteroidota bacterium]
MINFFRQFLKNPIQTGSLIPSSESFVKEIVKHIDFSKNKVIVEFGPGTGAVTSQILNSLNNRNTYFGIELNSELVFELNQKFPGKNFYNDTATTIDKYLRMHEEIKADVIISSIPLSLLNETEQREILECVVNNLSPNGEFVMYMYIISKIIKSGQRVEDLLDEYFPTTSRTKLIWNNFPPAYIYHCKKVI